VNSSSYHARALCIQYSEIEVFISNCLY
jgi:hypothetical protein